MRRICYVLAIAVVAMFLLPQCQSVSKEKKAKYVFYFIGDGMGVNQVNGTEMFLAEKDGRIGVKPLNFTQFPVSNHATTYSKYNSVTCSAAAGTALASGCKTKNGTIGMDSLQKTPVMSVAEMAKSAGRKVGVVTSVSVDHATPAAFYAHQPSRSMYYEIATDLPKAGFDMYAGAGFLELESKKDSTARNVMALIEEAGYTIARGNDDFKQKAAMSEKMVLLRLEGEDVNSLAYAIDRNINDLTLSQITENAIEFLSKNSDDGFFLMVEGGMIDWACHSNDGAAAFREVEDFADAIQKALDFYALHPDETLIVVTADHETGGIGLGTGKYALNLQALQHQKVSQGVLSKKITALRQEKNNRVAWEDVRQLLSENLGFWTSVPLNEKQEAKLKEKYEESFGKSAVELSKSLYSEDEPLAEEAVEILNRIAMVGWISGDHSAGVVPVYALGVGADLFNGRLDNTDIPMRIKSAGGY